MPAAMVERLPVGANTLGNGCKAKEHAVAIFLTGNLQAQQWPGNATYAASVIRVQQSPQIAQRVAGKPGIGGNHIGSARGQHRQWRYICKDLLAKKCTQYRLHRAVSATDHQKVEVLIGQFLQGALYFHRILHAMDHNML